MIKNLQKNPSNPKHLLADNQRFSGRAEHGKTTEFILCPYCNKKTMAYIWSLSGGGKKCDHCKDTLHGTMWSTIRFKTEEEAQKFFDEHKEQSCK